MFVVHHIARFCWKCVAKNVLLVGGTAGAVAGGVVLANRYSQKPTPEKPQTKIVVNVKEPPPPPAPPPAPIKAMPVKVRIEDEGAE